MFGDILRDLSALTWLVIIRVVLPLLIMFAVGWLLWRWFAPVEAKGRRISFFQFVFRVRERVGPIQLPQLSPGQTIGLMSVFLLWIAAAGFVLARLFWGIGAVTALSDITPWGLWIGFDVMSGVALAAGGFSLAATVYVFRLERFRPILRPAILTAMLGYMLVIFALLVDLGRWYNILHPIYMWNPSSVMFEVAWCVILYTTVLMLEFSQTVWERLHIGWMQKVLHKAIIPLVILGVMLSTLHQSSLGSLYLIFATKLDALWYTPLLPVLFFASALAVGLAMVMLESALSARAFKRPLENDLLASLAKPAVVILALYLVLKVGDLVVRGQVAEMFSGSFSSALMWGELALGVATPMVMLAVKRIRQDPRGRLIGAILIIGGVLLNRMDMAVFGFYDYTGKFGAVYVPSVGEWVVTFALVTAGVAAYWALVKLLPVLPKESHLSA